MECGQSANPSETAFQWNLRRYFLTALASEWCAKPCSRLQPGRSDYKFIDISIVNNLYIFHERS
jgi:hypothetical protein